MSNISYFRCGDYLLPNITLSEPPREQAEPITKYGAMRRSYLKTHRPMLYNSLMLSEQLFPHLREVQQEVRKRLDSLMANILALDSPPDKAADGLTWATHMETAHHIAEKMMLAEVIYI